MTTRLVTYVLLVLLAVSVWAETAITIDRSRQRELDRWKREISRYSLYHYGEETWRLRPSCIVLHYTVSEGFPWNLVRSDSFKGERPGLAVHYVVHGRKIWGTLPENVRSRGCYGINHRAINIEMVALDARDLSYRRETLDRAAQLCVDIMERHDISIRKIYGHQDVARMDPAVTPEVKDLINPEPYHKIDPGRSNLDYIKGQIKKIQARKQRSRR